MHFDQFILSSKLHAQTLCYVSLCGFLKVQINYVFDHAQYVVLNTYVKNTLNMSLIYIIPYCL